MWDQAKIFDYHDGQCRRYGDPLEIHHALTAALDGEVNKVLAQARCATYKDRYGNELPPPPDDIHARNCVMAYEATKKLVEAIRMSFGLQEFDPSTGKGATWKTCIEALNSFVQWEELQKKSGGPALTPSSVVVAPMSSPCPTSTSSASGSTSTERTGARQAS